MQKLDSTTLDILQSWIEGKHPIQQEQEALIARELSDETRAKAWGITKENCQQLIEARSQLFNSVCNSIFEWCRDMGIEKSDREIINLLWTFWLPLAINLVEIREKLDRTPIQGILGCQGSGKTTLTKILSFLLQHLGYTTATISLDDLYKTYEQRKELLEKDPRLVWRGPPGTHDINLGVDVLTKCLRADRTEKIAIPRFDKSAYKGQGDRSDPELISVADIVLFEGWFLGVRPLVERAFDRKIHPIVTPEDIQFAKDCNERLQSYLPLWELLDRLIVLYPEDYRFSKEWRKEAEQKAIARGKDGMSDEEVDRFVLYFWRALHPDLFIKTLINSSHSVDLVVEMKSDRSYGKIYKPN